MHDTTAIIAPRNLTPPAVGKNSNPRYSELYRRYPTIDYLRRGARRRLPHFAFEYGDGGSGKDDAGIKRNWTALDAVELVPRYGIVPSLPPCDIVLFGRRYAAPIGIAPMGGPAIVWPGADRHLARAANNDHAIGFDLVQRAAATACSALVLTLDVPVRTTRAREVVVGLGGAFNPDLTMILQMLMAPAWTRALWQNGIPRFSNLRAYVGDNASINDMVAFARREMGGAFTWGEVAKYRDRWKGTLIVKGIMHPEDAEKAVSLGVDGMFVSNHGGRQIEALPAPIDVLPAIVKQVGKRATVMYDSGIRSGTDVVRAYALGAAAAFAGKAFLWGLGALGEEGATHVIDILIEETQAALGQLGALTPDEARAVVIRHNGALHF